MKFSRLLLVFPLILTLVRAEAPKTQVEQSQQAQQVSREQVAAVSSNQAHAQHPHIKIPLLEELIVVRQKDSFVARKYRNYDTTTVTPSPNTEL